MAILDDITRGLIEKSLDNMLASSYDEAIDLLQSEIQISSVKDLYIGLLYGTLLSTATAVFGIMNTGYSKEEAQNMVLEVVKRRLVEIQQKANLDLNR